MSDGAGGTAALVGTALFGVGVLVATVAAFVILFRLKRPGTDVVARKVLVAAGVLGAVGLALFAWAAASGR
jgi:EamA domain-containing membrane protein RarD